MPVYQAVVLAVVQAFGEFLPISSSAHLILTRWLFGWSELDPAMDLTFDVALHAGTLGRGVRIYTSVLAPQPPAAASSFIPWETAQAGYVVSSRKLAAAILDQFNRQNADVPAELLPAPVRPLNNISSPALAIEVPPQHSVAETLGDATYQQSLATALAAAIAGVKPQLGATP